VQRPKKVGKRPTLDGDESPDGEFNPFKEGPKLIGKKKGKNMSSGTEFQAEKKESVLKSEEDDKKKDEVKKEKEAEKPIRSSLPWPEATASQPMKEVKAEEPIATMQIEQPVFTLLAHNWQNLHLPPLPLPEVTASEGNSEKLNSNKEKKIAKEKSK
jgi:hypothetical protein